MTREEFIEVLKKKGYSYMIVGGKIIVTRGGDVHLSSLTSLPPNVEFGNEGYVWLNSLTSLPPGVSFRNRGDVGLDALTSLPLGVVFENRGTVYLDSLTGGRFYDWKGNIEGINEKRLLNKMISIGLFER
jgi:hypothetical protein